MSWATAGGSKMSRQMPVRSSSLSDIDRSPSSEAGGARQSVGNATVAILLLTEAYVAPSAAGAFRQAHTWNSLRGSRTQDHANTVARGSHLFGSRFCGTRMQDRKSVV